MVASDDDGGADLAGGDEVVEEQAGFVALAEAEPADAGREALEAEGGFAVFEVGGEEGVGVGVAGEDPVVEAGVVAAGVFGEGVEECFVGDEDVARVA